MVLFNLGTISNYLCLNNGTSLPVTNFDFSPVQTAFSGNLTNAEYPLLAVTTPNDSLLRTWLSDGSASGVPKDETRSAWGAQSATINAVGSKAAAYSFPQATNQSLSIPSTDPNSYTSIASGGGSLDVTTMG